MLQMNYQNCPVPGFDVVVERQDISQRTPH